jgi:hypothetical protein
MTANLRSLRKFFRTRTFSRQDAKPQSSENVSFLRVFAPLREIIPALVAAVPRQVLRGERSLQHQLLRTGTKFRRRC